jgi:hypothetical protein
MYQNFVLIQASPGDLGNLLLELILAQLSLPGTDDTLDQGQAVVIYLTHLYDQTQTNAFQCPVSDGVEEFSRPAFEARPPEGVPTAGCPTSTASGR